MAALDQVPNVRDRNDLLGMALGVLAGRDPAAAMDYLATLPPAQRQISVYERVYENWASSDPSAAAAAAQTLPSQMRTSIYQTIVEAWAQKDPVAALTWAQSLPQGTDQRDVLSSVMSTMASDDPQSAASRLDVVPTSQRSTLINDVASAWADRDAPAALDWAGNLSGAERTSALNMILNNVAGNDPASAAAYVQSHPDTAKLNGVAGSIATQWAESDPAAALAWAQSLPSGRIQTEALSDVLTQQAEQDPGAVWNYISGASSNSAQFQELAPKVLEHWAVLDPAQAAQHVGELPEDLQLGSIANIAQTWLGQDSAQAMQWISALPGGVARDAAVEEVVENQSQSNPQTAFSWALSIGDDTMRQKGLRNAASELYRSSPALAQQVMQASNLSPEQQSALYQQAQRDNAQQTNSGNVNPLQM